MKKFTDDELIDDSEITPIKTTPKTTQIATEVSSEDETEEVTSKSKASAASDDDDLEEDADWADEKLATFSDGLDRLRPEKGSGNSVRFAMLGPADFPGAKLFKKADTIYIDKKGSYIVPDDEKIRAGISAKLESDPALTLIQLVLAYTNANKQGKYLPVDGKLAPIDWKIMYVQLSKTNFKDIRELPEEGSSVFDADFIMGHKNANGSGGYKFSIGSSAARWKKNAALVAEVKEAVAKFADGKKITKKLGKRITPIEWKLLLQGVASSADEADLDSLEEI